MNDQQQVPFHIARLISRALAGEITPPEQVELNTWMNARAANKALFDNAEALLEAPEQHPFRDFDTDAGWEDLLQRKRPRVRRMIWRAAVAAALIGLSVWVYQSSQAPKPTTLSDRAIAIKHDGVVLKGPDGQEVAIGQTEDTSFIIGSGKANVQSGTLEFGEGSDTAPVEFFTLRVPEGNRYQLRLPDGSQLWLNAASSVRFPNKFNGQDRKISITGEAYLEVAQQAGQPFIVEASGLNVRVLGTAFNIHAYENASRRKVTLISGSVQVAAGEKKVVLRPGQEAQVDVNGIRTGEADTEAAIAWRDGLFIFRNENIINIMEDISHWYGVQIEYDKQLQTNTWLSIRAERTLPLQQLLAMISSTGSASFTTEGNKVIVLPFKAQTTH